MANATNNCLKHDKKLRNRPAAAVAAGHRLPPLMRAWAGVPAWERGERQPDGQRCRGGHYWRPHTALYLWWANPKSNARCRFMAELLTSRR